MALPKGQDGYILRTLVWTRLQRMKVTHTQLEKISGYLLDISKLLMGVTFVSLFAQSKIVDFSLVSFIMGMLAALLTLLGGLYASSKIK